MRHIAIMLAGGVILAACAANPVQIANGHIARKEWMKAVLEYRKAVADHPSDIEYISRLKQTELKAADYYYHAGMDLLKRDNLEGAITQFQKGLAAKPDYEKLLQVMRQALLRKEAYSLYAEALRVLEAGQAVEGRRLLKRAMATYPEFKAPAERLAQLDRQAKKEEEAGRLKVSSHALITLNFRQTELRTAFEFIAKSFGIDVVFDDGVKTMPVTMFAKDVTFEEALNLILSTSKTFYKKVGPNAILIAPDTKEKRGQYEDQMVRVFQLTNMQAKEMADILKGVIPLKKIIVNDSLNTIIVRDTREAINVAEKVIRANDRRPAEVILEVEIIEVNRSKAERLGLDLSPYSIGAAVPAATQIPLKGNSIGSAFHNNAILTLPSATFNFYKQDVDAKTLANPRLRVLSGKNAKIHIGDRVPLRASVIQDATGQIRTTYDYKDIGIKLVADPIVHLDNSSTVKLSLEVSSLGQNLGTQADPAYSIGTRNADTIMLLRDGETAIIGGLIRDEDRKTRTRVPLLGDIPAVGSLFTSHDDSGGRTDVLLTITPRVVRGWDMPDEKTRMFESGSIDRVTSEPLLGSVAGPDEQAGIAAEPPLPEMAGTAKDNAAPEPVGKPALPAGDERPAVDKKAKDVAASSPAPASPAADAATPAPAPALPAADAATSAVANTDVPQQAASGAQPLLAFSDAVYQGGVGKEFEIRLTGENLNGATGMSTEILFNPQLLKYVRSGAGDIAAKNYSVEPDETHGVLRVRLNYPENAPARGNGVLTRIVMQGKRPGTSYIVYRSPALSGGGEGSANIQVRASRVVVK